MARRLIKLTKAEERRLAEENTERDKIIALLGMAPEDRLSPGERYVATTGELVGYAKREGKLPLDWFKVDPIPAS